MNYFNDTTPVAHIPPLHVCYSTSPLPCMHLSSLCAVRNPRDLDLPPCLTWRPQDCRLCWSSVSGNRLEKRTVWMETKKDQQDKCWTWCIPSWHNTSHMTWCLPYLKSWVIMYWQVGHQSHPLPLLFVVSLVLPSYCLPSPADHASTASCHLSTAAVTPWCQTVVHV